MQAHSEEQLLRIGFEIRQSSKLKARPNAAESNTVLEYVPLLTYHIRRFYNLKLPFVEHITGPQGEFRQTQLQILQYADSVQTSQYHLR